MKTYSIEKFGRLWYVMETNEEGQKLAFASFTTKRVAKEAKEIYERAQKKRG